MRRRRFRAVHLLANLVARRPRAKLLARIIENPRPVVFAEETVEPAGFPGCARPPLVVHRRPESATFTLA